MRIRRGILTGFFSACLLFLPTAVFTASIQVSWLPNTESDLGGYMVYCGTQPGVYTNSFNTGYATSFLLSGAQSGATYYIAVAAYDLNQKFSPLSVEKSVIVPAPAVPTAGINPLYPSPGAVVYANPVFSWSGRGFSSYRVYLSTNGKKFSRIYSGTGTSCSMQQSLWSLFIPSGTTLSWYVQGYTSTGRSTQSTVRKFIKG